VTHGANESKDVNLKKGNTLGGRKRGRGDGYVIMRKIR